MATNSTALRIARSKRSTGFSQADNLGYVLNSGAMFADLEREADLFVGYVLPTVACNSKMISCATGSLGPADSIVAGLMILGTNLKTTSGISNFDLPTWTNTSSQTLTSANASAMMGATTIASTSAIMGAATLANASMIVGTTHAGTQWLQSPAKTYIETLIDTEENRARVEPESVATARAAGHEAKLLVRREQLAGIPDVMISTDGIVSLVWEKGDLGAAMLFYGDGTVSLTLKTPTKFYSEGGVDLAVSDPLPIGFKTTISKLIA